MSRYLSAGTDEFGHAVHGTTKVAHGQAVRKSTALRVPCPQWLATQGAEKVLHLQRLWALRQPLRIHSRSEWTLTTNRSSEPS
jgi:hypothetical protein